MITAVLDNSFLIQIDIVCKCFDFKEHGLNQIKDIVFQQYLRFRRISLEIVIINVVVVVLSYFPVSLLLL